MKKNRLGYIFLVILSMVLLFAFGTPFLLLLLLFWIVFGLVLGAVIQWDARRIRLRLKLRPGGQAGEKSMMRLSVETKGSLLASRAVLVELMCHNRMFDTKEVKHLMLSLEDKNSTYEIPFPGECCGEVTVRCQGAYVYDLLCLFKIPIATFGEMGTVIYPRRVQMQVEMSRDTYGRLREEGQIQNRKGNDPSEMFNIREYMPGDDIRSVHWKLSSKTDTLIMREASDPSHYSLIVLIDLGLKNGEETIANTALNAAIAYGAGVMEQLVNENISFCIAIPTKTGLRVFEIREKRNFRQFLAMWFGIAMQENAGIGLQLFLSEHMEQKYTRLLVITAGEYKQELNGLDQRIGVTVIGTSQEEQAVYTSFGNSLEMIGLPENLEVKGRYSIRC